MSAGISKFLRRLAGASALTWSLCSGAEPILTWGDQGDGTYRNPVIKSDYSDPDLIRVGSDFYLIASDMHYMGIQVLHSKDLVNWEIAGQVFHRLSIDPRYDEMKGYGMGTWAPSLRYHDGQFYLYVCTPTEGLFLWRAKEVAGPWEQFTIKTIPGWEDPCPFWDDDGSAWLVHSKKGAGPLYLHRMSEDGTKLLDDGVEIYHGRVAEGPKVYKRHGFYYICLPEGGVNSGGQTILRSRSLHGPYERRVVLPNGSPHQGGLVELDNGEAWFLCFKFDGFLGRVCHLLPVHWESDDWPVFGDNGKPVLQWRKPDVGATYPVSRPVASDDFDGASLGLQWQWNHNPIDDAWSLTERPGWLRLKARPAASLDVAHNTLTQKLWDDTGTIVAKLDTRNMGDGQKAGLTFVSGSTFAWAGAVQDGGKRWVAWTRGAGGEAGADLWIKGSYSAGQARLAFSNDGKRYVDTGQQIALKFADWKGARFGIFSYGDSGAADFDFVRYEYAGIPAKR